MSGQVFTAGDLVAKLREYPAAAKIELRTVGQGKKIIMVVEGHELDPVFQCGSTLNVGYGPVRAAA